MTFRDDSKPLQGIDWFSQYPKKELYRLIVDGSMHENGYGWVKYESREEGCLKAAFSGLALAVTNLHETTLTIDLIKKLHAACTSKVKHLNEGLKPGYFRQSPASFPLTIMEGRNATPDGLEELITVMKSEKKFYENEKKSIKSDQPRGSSLLIEGDNGKNYFLTGDHFEHVPPGKAEAFISKIAKEHIHCKSYSIKFAAPFYENIERKMVALVNHYNQSIKEANNLSERLSVIVKTTADFDRLHPFPDANIRTFAILLLSRLLVQNGFPPATFANPNVFDGHSQNELIAEVKQAMKNTVSIIQGKKNIFSFNSDLIPAKYNNKYQECLSGFVQTVAKEAAIENIRKQQLGLDRKTLDGIVSRYDAYKKEKKSTFFTSNETKETQAALKKATSDEERYYIAMNYVNKYPTRAFAQEIHRTIRLQDKDKNKLTPGT